MDKKTEDLRRRIKAERTPRNEFSSNYEARGLGRKGKSNGTFPNARCNFREDGLRCCETALFANVQYRTIFGIAKGRFCEEHLKAARASMVERVDPIENGSPRSGMS